MAFRPDSPLVTQVAQSPNHGERRAGVDILLLHYTGMQTAAAAIARLCSPASDVSAHYVVVEEGGIVQCVPEVRRAWHAGASTWAGETDINSRSIGIEIVNPGHEFGYVDFPDAQIDAVIALCRDILRRHAIPADRVLAHSDVAAARKQDPGEKFPWDRLYAAGIGHWVAPVPLADGTARLAPGDEGPAVAALQARLRRYGYALDETGRYDPATEAVVRAFQRHFRPARVDGIADDSTSRTLAELIRCRPVRPVAPSPQVRTIP